MRKASFRLATLSCFVVAGSVVTGCSSGPEPSDPHDRLAETKAAITKPTGTVNATSMKSLASFYASIQAAQPVFAALGYANNSAKCQTGTSVDLACATQGSANAVTGSVDISEVNVQSTANGITATIVYDFKNVCAQGVCVDGNMIGETVSAGSGGNTVTAAFSADVTQNGKKTHIYFGEKVSASQSASGSSVDSKTVIFDSTGNSIVMDASVMGASAMFSIVGNNGSFQCSVTPQGGACSGSATFNY